MQISLFRGRRADPPVLTSMLSPKQLALAVGVSESSMKRWVDDGRVRAQKTAGGHRRIPLDEAIRFVRESRLPLVEPSLLGLGALERVPEEEVCDLEQATQALTQHLVAGSAAEAHSLLLGLYLNGHELADLFDGPLRRAMESVGMLWHDGGGGIAAEHRATDICNQALNALRSLLPVNAHGPIALGGGLSGDPYLLPTLSVAIVLQGAGFRVVHLGPDTPGDAFLASVAHLGPRLVWASLSSRETADASHDVLARIARACETGRRIFVVGGRVAGSVDTSTLPGQVRRLDTLGELAVLASALRTQR